MDTHSLSKSATIFIHSSSCLKCIKLCLLTHFIYCFHLHKFFKYVPVCWLGYWVHLFYLTRWGTKYTNVILYPMMIIIPWLLPVLLYTTWVSTTQTVFLKSCWLIIWILSLSTQIYKLYVVDDFLFLLSISTKENT